MKPPIPPFEEACAPVRSYGRALEEHAFPGCRQAGIRDVAIATGEWRDSGPDAGDDASGLRLR